MEMLEKVLAQSVAPAWSAVNSSSLVGMDEPWESGLVAVLGDGRPGGARWSLVGVAWVVVVVGRCGEWAGGMADTWGALSVS